jgi:hypothetical protein
MRLLKFSIVFFILVKMTNFFNERFYNIRHKLKKFQGSDIVIAVILNKKIIYKTIINENNSENFYEEFINSIKNKYIIEKYITKKTQDKKNLILYINYIDKKLHHKYTYPFIDWNYFQQEKEPQEKVPVINKNKSSIINYLFNKNIVTVED